MKTYPLVAKQGRFGRWYITTTGHPDLAWTGARWTTHDRGLSTGAAQVCNFTTEDEAEDYIDSLMGPTVYTLAAPHLQLP